MATTEDVLHHLRDASYPATKDDLVAFAQERGAPEDVVKALRAMPPEEYRNSAEVGRSAHTDPPVTDTSRGMAQAHDKTHERIAKSDRDPGTPEPLH